VFPRTRIYCPPMDTTRRTFLKLIATAGGASALGCGSNVTGDAGDNRSDVVGADGSTSVDTGLPADAPGTDVVSVPETYDYYIGPNGNDANPGTSPTAPWALTAVNTKRMLYAGHRVGFLDGNYDLRALVGPPTSNTDYTGSWLRISGGPDDAHRTVFKSVSPRGAVLDGGRGVGAPHQSAVIGVSGDNYVTIDGFKVTHSNYCGVSVYRATGFTIQNCWIDDVIYENLVDRIGQNAGAIRLLACTHVLIRNNLITNFDAPADGHRMAGIMSIDDSPFMGSAALSDSVIESNSIIQVTGGSVENTNGIHLKNPGNRRNVLRYNFVSSAVGNCVSWHGNDTDAMGVEEFHHNVLVGRGDYGAFASEGASNRRRIWNNTIVSTTSFTTSGLHLIADTGTLDFFNNVLVRNTASWRGDVALARVAQLAVCDYNFYGDSTPGVEVTLTLDANPHYRSLAEWQTASGKEAHSINRADPGFVGSGARAEAYRLTASSPCVGAGRSDGTGTGSPCDMGAWGNDAPARIGCDF
jgi:hypothetical protein